MDVIPWSAKLGVVSIEMTQDHSEEYRARGFAATDLTACDPT
jgi:hypothetical protein